MSDLGRLIFCRPETEQVESALEDDSTTTPITTTTTTTTEQVES